jgi:hypothetical protein
MSEISARMRSSLGVETPGGFTEGDTLAVDSISVIETVGEDQIKLGVVLPSNQLAGGFPAPSTFEMSYDVSTKEIWFSVTSTTKVLLANVSKVEIIEGKPHFELIARQAPKTD